MAVMTINLEHNRPTVEAARVRLGAAVRTARAQRVDAIKLIHGYGSSGTGGKIRTMVRQELSLLKQAGKIRAFAPGEEFSPFEKNGQQVITLCFELTRDRDYTRCNHGITVVVL